MTQTKQKQRILAIFLIIPLILCTCFFVAGNASVDSVYLGGMPIGVVQQCDGVVVADFVDVNTVIGVVSPAQKAGVLKGDLIKSINDIPVYTPEEVEKLTQNNTLSIAVKRGENIVNIPVLPMLDVTSNRYKLGLSLKNELSGVGTMTYVTVDKKFGAVGHKIYDKNISTQDAFPTGSLYQCKIASFEKSENNKIGNLRGTFNRKTDKIGTVNSNTKFGMFGTVETDFVDMTLIKVGSKEEVLLGAATIFTTIKGDVTKEYSIEIIKIENQPTPKEKSLIIKLTDDELLSATGGILQGMSGSPIVQNGKLIGAVTHVFTSNAVYGYGVFIDWMLDN